MNLRLKEIRTEHGMKQKELADALGFEQTSVSGWEIGRREPSLSELVSIAKIFNVTVDYLIGMSDSRDSYTEPPDKMTEDEQALIEAYRALDKRHQRIMLGRMEECAEDAQKEKEAASAAI